MTIASPSPSPQPLRLQPTGWLRYFSFSLDHKVIGLQYIVCGFLFYFVVVHWLVSSAPNSPHRSPTSSAVTPTTRC